MVALQIRDVPKELRDRLTEIARSRGQSLQAYLFDVISNEARRKDNLAALERFSRKSYNAHLSSDDVLDVLHDARADRDTALGLPEIDT